MDSFAGIPDLGRYRPNVGVVLLAADGRAWLGRRADVPGPRNWQFPQGGVDPGESLEAAAIRELREETGARSARVVGRTEDWLAYEFPPHARRARGKDRWIGQKGHPEVEHVFLSPFACGVRFLAATHA